MKRTLLCIVVFLLLTTFSPVKVGAQCTNSQLDWDYRDYPITPGKYSGNVTNAMAATQHFTPGTCRTTIAISNADVQFTPTRDIFSEQVLSTYNLYPIAKNKI